MRYFGILAATAAAATAALAVAACSSTGGNDDVDVSLADLNFVHGLFCPPETDRCRLSDRVDLLLEFIEGSGCPDVVALQEIWPPTVAEIEVKLPGTCPFTYQVVLGERLTNVDDEMVLSRYPVTEIEQRDLLGGFRRVLFTRIDHPTGTLDVFSTHLAAGVDGGSTPCGPVCPAECVAAGAQTIRDCQAVQMAEFIEAKHDVPGLAFATGDFNAPPGSFVYEQFAGRGWIDTYLAAGNPECNPATGIGCTSGREDEGLDELESPALNETSRIDFAFLIPPEDGADCEPELLPADGIGPGTQLFAEVPNPFAEPCGPLPEAICWPSDHIGTQVAIQCD
ncbi:MAG: hypothetical protein FJ144_07660 [Deltaproteobacteria bacterium]|nr:hypothetical protein [Deltaproteobacteria bacterium]